MSDEHALIGRIAANLRRAMPAPEHGHEPSTRPAAAATARLDDPAALVARFTAEWQALTGHLHSAGSADEAAEAVGRICAAHGADEVLAWSDDAIGIAGLGATLAAHGIRADHGWVPRDPAERAVRLERLATLRVGLTGADALLAESGSIVVIAGPGRPRLASLLPPVHVTIVRPTRVYLSIEHLLSAEPSLGDAGSNLVAISGPSRTADIEMTLTRGVHGPGEVHVVLLGDSS